MFTVVVTEVNTAPVLGSVAPQTVVEQAELVVTNAATDTDVPANTLSYALVNGPAGATIDGTGVIQWTPGESDGPGTNVFETVATDSGDLKATNSFTVVVTEINTAPVLGTVAEQTVAEQTELVVTNAATDLDVPVNTLSYALVIGPAGATIDGTGVIRWTPGESDGPGTNLFETEV